MKFLERILRGIAAARADESVVRARAEIGTRIDLIDQNGEVVAALVIYEFQNEIYRGTTVTLRDLSSVMERLR